MPVNWDAVTIIWRHYNGFAMVFLPPWKYETGDNLET